MYQFNNDIKLIIIFRDENIHLLIDIINEQEYQQDIVLEINNNKIHGTIIIDSSGTARMKTENSDAHIFESSQYMIQK